MKFAVYELPKACWDNRDIFEWLFERSPRGATAWLDAYDRMIGRLTAVADTMPRAQEANGLDLEVNEILFKSARGRFYRAVFHLDGGNVYILRIRGPGQAPIASDDLTP